MFRFLKRYASSDDRRESQHAIAVTRREIFARVRATANGGTGAGTVQGR